MTSAPLRPHDPAGGIFAGSSFVLESAVVDRRGSGPRSPDHVDPGRSVERDALRERNAIAAAHLDDDRVTEAVPLFELTLSDARRLLGPVDPDTLVVEGNLAVAYVLAGQGNTGIELMCRTLALRTEVLGADHPATRTASDALVAAHLRVGHP